MVPGVFRGRAANRLDYNDPSLFPGEGVNLLWRDQSEFNRLLYELGVRLDA